MGLFLSSVLMCIFWGNSPKRIFFFMLHKPIMNYLNSVIGKKIDEKRYMKIVTEQNEMNSKDSDSVWDRILKTSLVDNFITNCQISKYREIYKKMY